MSRVQASKLQTQPSHHLKASRSTSLNKSRPNAKILDDPPAPTHYLMPVGGVAIINHPLGSYWASGGTYLQSPADGEIVGLAFNLSMGGSCSAFKRMSAAYTGGSGFELWGNTSDDDKYHLHDGETHVTILNSGNLSGEQIKDLLLPGAILIADFNRPQNNISTWAGFQLGWGNCYGSATVSNFGLGLQGIALRFYGLGISLPIATTLWGGGMAATNWATTAVSWLLAGNSTSTYSGITKNPNPNGRLGSQPHKDMITQIKDNVNGNNLFPQGEYKVLTPGGAKPYRYVDVAALDANSNPVAFYQVGKITQGDIPVARERLAINDIYEFGKFDVPIIFIAFWK